MHTTPHSLLARLSDTPEQAAWARFVELYAPLMMAWAHRLGLRDHDAADLVQDVFAILVVKLPQFRYDPNKSFRAWLKTILLNCWRKRRGPKEETYRGQEPTISDSIPEFEEVEYRQFIVRRALGLMQAEFQPETWKACWEFLVEGRAASAVASELGISLNAVYLAKSRVLRRLREELSGLLA